MSEAGKCTRGFTLLEAMVALAIMALIAGIAFPAIARLLARQRVVAARTTVTLALARGRSVAVRLDQPVTIAPDPGLGHTLVAPGVAPLALPDAVSLEWPRGGITIYGDGSAAPASGVIHAGAQALAFTIDPATAQPRFTP